MCSVIAWLVGALGVKSKTCHGCFVLCAIALTLLDERSTNGKTRTFVTTFNLVSRLTLWPNGWGCMVSFVLNGARGGVLTCLPSVEDFEHKPSYPFEAGNGTHRSSGEGAGAVKLHEMDRSLRVCRASGWAGMFRRRGTRAIDDTHDMSNINLTTRLFVHRGEQRARASFACPSSVRDVRGLTSRRAGFFRPPFIF